MEAVFPSENSKQDADSAFPPAHAGSAGRREALVRPLRVGSAGTIGTQKFGELKPSVRSVPNLPRLGTSPYTKRRNQLAIWRLSRKY